MQIRPIAEQGPEALVAAALAEHGRIDVVVSNDFIPGTLRDPAPSCRSPAARPCAASDSRASTSTSATLEQLVILPFTLLQAVVPSMKAQGGGAINFVTSEVSYRAGPEDEAYSATTASHRGWRSSSRRTASRST